MNEALQKQSPKRSVEFSYQKLRKTDLSKVNNCLVEIVNAGCKLSSRHWKLIPVREGKLVINGEEKILSHDLIDVPESFLVKLPIETHIDLKSTSSKHFDFSSWMLTFFLDPKKLIRRAIQYIHNETIAKKTLVLNVYSVEFIFKNK